MTGCICWAGCAIFGAGLGLLLGGWVHGFWGSLQLEVLYWEVKDFVMQMSVFYEEGFPIMEREFRMI